MEFGTLIFTKPERAVTDPKLAEDLGYSHAWIPDSHMIWGDVWACMALAAVNTTRIKLATGVAIATPVPSLIREVFTAASAMHAHTSPQIMCESGIHACE